jgi:hypothetical protein
MSENISRDGTTAQATADSKPATNAAVDRRPEAGRVPATGIDPNP